MGGIAERWRVLSGSDNWKGLLDPLDSDLRRYLIHYAAMICPSFETLITEPASKNIGLPRYTRRDLFANTGLVKGNPFKYEVTKYFYAASGYPIGATGYNVRPERRDAVLKESNWNGYVAVATDEGKVALGRRDILNSDPQVHRGWYEMYTAINQDSVLNENSARDQIRKEVARLVELYKNEELSITVTGHSLGSSMATLNATDLAVNPIKPDIPVTAFFFAGPKVGDENFKNAFAKQSNLRGLRITDVNDIVTKIPPFGWPLGGELLPIIPYQDVGEGLIIESKKSDYLKPELSGLGYHDLVLYMHAIDGFQGPQGGIEPQRDFDIAKINKYQDALKDEYNIPVAWLTIKDKGMVQQEDGSYTLDDHEVDETF
nr:phospholipase A1-II 1-like [Ipomoea batatas]